MKKIKKETLEKIQKIREELGTLKKDSKNPHFKSSYLSLPNLLEHLDPILKDNNMMILQPIQDDVVRTLLIDLDNEECMESSMKICDSINPQKRGSEITYYRRYQIESMLCLKTEDDDANNSSGSSNENNDDKKWLNKFNKEGEQLADYWKVVQHAVAKGVGIDELKKHYKISKAVQKELETDLLT